MNNVLAKGGRSKYEGSAEKVLDSLASPYELDPKLDPRKVHGKLDGNKVKLPIPIGRDLNNLTPEQTNFYRNANIGTVIHEIFHRGFSYNSGHREIAIAIMAAIPIDSDESKRLGISSEQDRKKVRKDSDKSEDLIDAAIREFCPSP